MNNKLKAKIIEVYGTQLEMCYDLKIPQSVLSRKMNGVLPWSESDKEKIGEALKIHPKRYKEFFKEEKDERTKAKELN